MAIPKNDSALVPWTTNFDSLINTGFATYGLTSAQAAAYHTLHQAYLTAYAAASNKGTRSQTLTAARDAARQALLDDGRVLYTTIQASLAVTDAQKVQLGITVRKTTPSPVPPPSTAPQLSVTSVAGRTASVRLADAQNPHRKGKPPGVVGASVFSFVGAAAPADLNDWKFEANVGRPEIEVVFPSTLAVGTTVWLTAFWFNNRKQSSPASNPVSAVLPGGGVSQMAA